MIRNIEGLGGMLITVVIRFVLCVIDIRCDSHYSDREVIEQRNVPVHPCKLLRAGDEFIWAVYWLVID